MWTVVLVLIGLSSLHQTLGIPVSKRLGKRSLSSEKGATINSWPGHSVGELTLQMTAKKTRSEPETDVARPAAGKGETARKMREVIARQRILLTRLLEELDKTKAKTGKHTPKSLTEGLSKARYKKRGLEQVMSVPNSKSSARAAFLQARRRMGPEFNPTGW